MKPMLQLIDSVPRLEGMTTIFSFNPETGKISQMVFQKNTIMDGAAECVAKLMMGDILFKVAAMYFEYVNLAAPGDTPVPPSYVKSDGVEYFTGLQYSADVDFLRVAVLSTGVPTKNVDGDWVETYFAVTPGDEIGFWGKAFTPAANSAVYGGALVASPEPSVQSNDVVIARNYPTGAKVMKPSGEQICMTWSIKVLKP